VERMDKIAILITSKGRPGGVERRFLTVANAISEKKDAECYLISSQSFVQELSETRATKISLKNRGLLPKIFEVVRILRRNRIKKLHIASNPSLLSAGIALLGKAAGIKVSQSSVDSSKVKKEQFPFLSRLAYIATYRFVHRVDFLSDAILKTHKKLFGVVQSKSRVSECSFLASNVEKVEETDRDIDLCFVARLVPLKGIELLFDALSETASPLNVHICGDGPMRYYIKSRTDVIENHNIYVGYCENPIETLSRSKVFLSLQAYNNYPSQSVFEAIKSGCLVVATDVGETRKILNEENSILIKDKATLVNAIEVALENDGLRESLIQESEKVFQKHNIENFSDYFEREILGLESSR
jgi:glycosyltransferase involved in cell wall biosynthesis